MKGKEQSKINGKIVKDLEKHIDATGKAMLVVFPVSIKMDEHNTKGRTETWIASGFRNPESLMAPRKLPLNLVFDESADLPTQCCARLTHRNTYYLPDFTNAVVPTIMNSRTPCPENHSRSVVSNGRWQRNTFITGVNQFYPYETAAINFRDSNRNRWLKDGTSYFRTVTPVCFREYRVTEMYASFVEDCEEFSSHRRHMAAPYGPGSIKSSVSARAARIEGSHARPADIGQHPLCSPMYRRPSFNGIDGLRPASSVREVVQFIREKILYRISKLKIDGPNAPNNYIHTSHFQIMFYDWPMHTPILCTFTKYWPTSFNIDNYVGEVQAKWTPWCDDLFRTDPVIASNGPMKTVLHVEDLVATFMTIAKTDSNLLNFICIARIPLNYTLGIEENSWPQLISRHFSFRNDI
ncbi:hypothetical protein G5I_07274 [Acromyrmex echinatior]|uniref:Uncharacterized protein n=1 Tax=Acromyrmex echinatior TaxID=103372 RepID=F4WNB9_ACREC|nr:hypothetical protein G5I_07274 [Acromyrmex echinatior]